MTKFFFGAFYCFDGRSQHSGPRRTEPQPQTLHSGSGSVPDCGSECPGLRLCTPSALPRFAQGNGFFKAGQWRPQKHLDKKREKIVVTFIQATVRRFSSSLSFARKHKLGERLKSSCSFCLWIQVLLEQQPKVRSRAAGPYPRRHSHRSPSPKVRTLVLPPRPIWQRHVAAAPVL